MHSPVTLLIYALCFTVVEAQIPNPYEYDYEDNKKCPLTESIRGGTVSYSAGGEQGSVLTYHCKDGYEPHPVRQRTCSPEGVWIEQVSLVICQEKEGDYDYGDYEVEVKNCSMSEVIEGGNVSYSNLGFEGSMLTYHCQAGYYPYPVSQKICNSEGQWSAMGLPFGKPVTKAKCKEVFCPAQLQLDNGEIWPRQQWFQVGEQQNFSCQDGFVLLGSAQRNCTQWGTWTGSTPVCDNQVDDCQNPGTPPGATRSGERFRTGEKVLYRCHTGLDLLGSSERVCLESREWSGSEPRCLAQYAFDSPSSVAQAMGGSLSGVMDVSSPEFKKKESFGRTFNMADGRINVFILLDTSGSITQKHFDEARDATASLIRKLDSYEVTMKFHIISYASQPKDIVNIRDHSSDNVEYVLDKLQKFNHTSHGQKRGTNLYSALSKVYEAMVFLKAQNSSKFSETQNVILIETDGHLNMGAHPKSVLEKIRDLMGYKTSENDNTKEDLLDVYVFGIGDSVNKKQLNAISSSKRKEKHFFILKDYKQLGEVFNKMISDTAVTTCGIAQEAISKDSSEKSSKKTYTRPWHVQVYWDDLSKKSTTCQGSILTEKWVITAAHCLMKPQDGLSVNATSDKVTVKHGNGSVRARSLHLHPRYNIHGLKAKNVKEFYDYDVALIEVDDIKLSWKARPICLPCTKPSNQALKLSQDSTCEKHKSSLLHLDETQAHFISRVSKDEYTRMQTHIQRGVNRQDCIEKASTTFSSDNQASLTEVVTDRFMCTGGSSSYKDAISCKGDSGGALFLRKGMRYFQVGVLSWGTKDVCDSKGKGRTHRADDPPQDARDFHIDLFSIMPWLKHHLGQEMEFLPMDG